MRIIKHFVINTVAIYLISQVVQGMSFIGGPVTVVLAGAVLTVAAFLVKPLVNILLLPVNLLTFGLFRWVSYAVTLYLVTLLVPGFKILNFSFAGVSSYWVAVPAIQLSGVMAFLAFSFLVSSTSSFISWIMK